jgi:hypothetical protein
MATARVKELAAVYGDYQPAYFGCSPGYEEAVHAGRRRTKNVPKEIEEVRRAARALK